MRIGPQPAGPGESGAALVVSLIFLILISITLIGFVTTARQERRTANTHFSRTQAEMLSAMASSVAASRLANAMDPANAWVTGPGRIVATPLAGGATETIALHSGQADSSIEDVSVDLNPRSLLADSGLITRDSNLDFAVRWIYVREDGSQSVATDTPPAYSASNPVIGRYAFWTDDHSGKINWNTAASSTNPAALPPSHPGHVPLDQLLPLTTDDIDAVRAAREARLFDSVDHPKRLVNSPTLRQAIDENTFSLTHYNHSPELNIFNEPRIVLTTQKALAGDAPFFDILKQDNTDPGLIDNIDPVKYRDLFLRLYGLFNRTDWPFAPGKSLGQKFDTTGSAQIILNLIDYVRSAESDMKVVQPGRGTFVPATGNFTFELSFGSPNARMGHSRRFQITKVGVWIRDTSPFFFSFRIQVYWPANAGVEIDLMENNRNIFLEMRSPELNKPVSKNLPITAADIQGGNRIMQPGQFRTISKGFRLDDVAPNNFITSGQRPDGPVFLRAAIRLGDDTTPSVDIAPTLAGDTIIPYELDPPGVPQADITAVCIDDPYVNQSRFDWTIRQPEGFKSHALAIESTLGKAPTLAAGNPQQDTDSAGNLTNVGARFPAFKGTVGNPLGLVQSVGELGRIHSGGRGTAIAGVPWRTLRLQPKRAGDDFLPDWVLLDLFTVTDKAKGLLPEGSSPAQDRNNAVLRPHPHTIAGQINLNTALADFGDAAVSTARPLPLQAAVLAAGNPDAAVALTMAANVAAGTLATGPNPGVQYPPAVGTPIYWMPGQLAEIDRFSNLGEVSEQQLSAMLPFVTNRGSVFSVFAVGQNLIQTPDGRIVVRSESRTNTLLEMVPEFVAGVYQGAKPRILSQRNLDW